MIGRLIGNYKILEKLSQTENFGVYKAVDLLLNRSVVIKTLNQKNSRRPDVAENFRSQAATLAKLDHKSIPALYSLTAAADELFMVSEYSEGETLDRILLREETVSFQRAVSIFIKVFDCVEYAHKSNIAHGSLKSSDVLLTDTGSVKILGYGAIQSADKENDISALAAMLYESLTGRSDFGAPEKSERKISEAIESVIKKALFFDSSAAKFKSVAEFRDALIAAGFVVLDGKIESTMEKKSSELQKSLENLIEKTTVKKSKSSISAIGGADFFKRKSGVLPKEIKLKPISTGDLDDKITKLSKKSKQRNYKFKVAGAAMFAVLVLHLVWQFSFVQSENLRDTETALKTIQPTAPPSQPEINELSSEPKAVNQPDQINADFKAKTNIVNSEKTVQKARYERSEAKSEPPKVKKKAVRESKTERLRRAEKLLTGM